MNPEQGDGRSTISSSTMLIIDELDDSTLFYP
jgi:hypothetical protein